VKRFLLCLVILLVSSCSCPLGFGLVGDKCVVPSTHRGL